MLIIAIAALLLFANSPTLLSHNGQTFGQTNDFQNSTGQLPDDNREKNCRSDEIRDHLSGLGIVPPSQQAQESLLEGATPEVRLIYLVPSDMQPRPEVPITLANGIKHLQRFYWEQMGNGKTFTLHDPVVEVLRSSHEREWFYTNPAGDNPSLFCTFND
jgi:hypothetical protein